MDLGQFGYSTIENSDEGERLKAIEDSTDTKVVIQDLPVLAYCKNCKKTNFTEVKTECDCSEVPMCLLYSLLLPICYCCCTVQMSMIRKTYHYCSQCKFKLFTVANNLLSFNQVIQQSPQDLEMERKLSKSEKRLNKSKIEKSQAESKLKEIENQKNHLKAEINP
ncbi:unnamed protein product [Moneuplotes crassus]|uniref:LITAF domain-containing protein n=1 Tax=Euplotes crassus TaxID=5936 RepID=A0AAD2D4S3_EUPCR|nr:unnamed protein product [Moneuplotes crassus]